MKRCAASAIVSAILFGVAGCTGGSWSGTGPSFQSTFGHDCTVQGARYRAERGHAYKGQCAGNPLEGDIAMIHERELLIRSKERQIEHIRLGRPDTLELIDNLQEEHDRLAGYWDLRPLMSDATRTSYERHLQNLDASIDWVRDGHIPSERERIAQLQAEIATLRADFTVGELGLASTQDQRDTVWGIKTCDTDQMSNGLTQDCLSLTEEEIALFRAMAD